jgi:hypothetical protein
VRWPVTYQHCGQWPDLHQAQCLAMNRLGILVFSSATTRPLTWKNSCRVTSKRRGPHPRP